MNKVLIGTGLLAILFFQLGCVPATNTKVNVTQEIYTTHLHDVTNINAPRLNSFGKGEVAVIVVRGYSGETVTYDLIDLTNGSVMDTRTHYIPEGQDYYWTLGSLGAGSYIVNLKIHGVHVKSWKFSKSGENSVSSASKLFSTYYNSAEKAYKAFKWNEAESLARAALNEASNSWEEDICLYVIGVSCVAQEKYIEAEPLLKKILPTFEKYEDRTFEFTILLNLYHIENNRKDHITAVSLLENCLSIIPDDPTVKNGLAWLLSTSYVSELRDSDKAIILAKQVVEQTSRKKPAYLDTLAAALAEAGRYQEAVQIQKEAIALLTDADAIEDYNTRLRIYLSNNPYHQPK